MASRSTRAAGAFDDADGLDGEDLMHSRTNRGASALREVAVDELSSSRTRCAAPTYESSALAWRVGRNDSDMPKRRIDYTDIPQLSDEQLSHMRRVGRPPLGRVPRTAISVRVDRDVLARLKARAAKRGVPYQSLINDILARAMKRAG